VKKLLLTGITALFLATGTAHARPQMHTPAIGWIDPSDIRCFATSDHICEVTMGCGDCSAIAFIWVDQHGMRRKYRIVAKTQLVVLDAGKDNVTMNENDHGDFTFVKRVKVAIVIDADWDNNNGQLVPTVPGCRLTTEGKFPPIVSVECSKKKR
jgi:hypothetical protein